MQSTQRLTKTTTTIDATNRAWNVTGSFLVTGEAAAYGQVRVKKPFDPARKQWGALQILARYSALSVDRGVFDAGLAAANASREATQLTVAANWYPVSYIKWYVTFERTTFDAPASRPVENTFLFRAQLGF
jgi:phosphate-selective porin OprO/OprP